METVYESGSFVQISLQKRIIERISATSLELGQLPCGVKAAKLGSRLSTSEICANHETSLQIPMVHKSSNDVVILLNEYTARAIQWIRPVRKQ